MATDFGFEASKNKSGYYFVSYNTEDSDRVAEICHYLHDAGLDIWYDEGIPRNSRWKSVIGKKIRKSTQFIIFITKGLFVKAQRTIPKEGLKHVWTHREFEIAEEWKEEDEELVVVLDEWNDIKDYVHEDLSEWFADLKSRQVIYAAGMNANEAADYILKELTSEEKPRHKQFDTKKHIALSNKSSPQEPPGIKKVLKRILFLLLVVAITVASILTATGKLNLPFVSKSSNAAHNTDYNIIYNNFLTDYYSSLIGDGYAYKFCLLNIDDDDIPELFIKTPNGGIAKDAPEIYRIVDGKVEQIFGHPILEAYGYFLYGEKENKLIRTYQGRDFDDPSSSYYGSTILGIEVYELSDNGFTTKWHALAHCAYSDEEALKITFGEDAVTKYQEYKETHSLSSDDSDNNQEHSDFLIDFVKEYEDRSKWYNEYGWSYNGELWYTFFKCNTGDSIKQDFRYDSFLREYDYYLPDSLVSLGGSTYFFDDKITRYCYEYDLNEETINTVFPKTVDENTGNKPT